MTCSPLNSLLDKDLEGRPARHAFHRATYR